MWRIDRPLVALVLVAAGCGAQLGDGPDQQSATTDANNGGGGGGGGGGNGSGGGNGGGMKMDAAVGNACANGRVVYLDFDGVTLAQATTTDSTQNRASWLTTTSSAIPRFHDGVTGRDTEIATIVAGVKSRLANTPITVLSTRPASGPYVMIVFGGQRTADGGTVGTQYSYATGDHDCGDLVKNDIGWVSDVNTVSFDQDLAIGSIGWGLGLNGTTNGDDCMAGWANNTSSNSGACSLSASIATTTSSSPATTCPNQNPQNEVAAFSTGFCQ